MLVQTTAKCKVCGKEFNGILQYLKRTCTRCGKVIEPICDECAAKVIGWTIPSMVDRTYMRRVRC